MNYSFLSQTALFQGTSEDDIKNMMSCIGGTVKTFKKGEYLFLSGDIIHSMGLVLHGKIVIENDDIWGNKSILSLVSPGQIFGETYACIPNQPLMVNVLASEDSEVLFLNTSRILHFCKNTCKYHEALIKNLLFISAQKNLVLSRRIFHTSSKSIRSRLLSYFSEQSINTGSTEFVIPFNRQQLADYLGVDRSAMSNELSKMQKEGIISFRKNSFTINK